MQRSFTTRYGIAIALIAAAMCFGGISLAQQTQPTAPVQAPAQIQPQPVAIGGPVGAPTYVIPPSPEQKKAPGGLIDIGQAFSDVLAPYINAAANALILALVGWACKRFTDRTGIEVDKGHRDAIVRGLQNQAGSLLADGKVKMQGLAIHVDNAAIATAANNLLKSLPDAEKHFGLTPEYVQQRIMDMIPQTPAGAALVAQAHTGDMPATAADVAASGAAVTQAIKDK